MKKYKILVVDDRLSNGELGSFYEFEKAREQFAGKNVELRVICNPLAAALVLKNKAKFDIVLVNLMMEGSNEGLNYYLNGRSNEPYGLALAIIAKNEGVEHVAILTDLNLHSKPIVWALHDMIGINSFVSCFNNTNWLEAAQKFVEIRDVPPEETLSENRKRIMLAGVNDTFKRELQSSLPLDLDVIFIKESETEKAFDIFLYGMPELTILVGNISDVENEHSIGKIFRDMRGARRNDQNFLAVGWEDNKQEYYLQLPRSCEDILKQLQQ